MPSFTTQRPDLLVNGPIVEILVTVSRPAAEALKKQGIPIPKPVLVTALIDTGASGTVIQKGVAAQLGLHPVGVTAITTPSCSGVQCPIYALACAFPQTQVLFETTAVEAPLHGQNIQCLLGRDILSKAVFIYIGYSNQFTLSF